MNGLARRLRLATRPLHEAAEGAGLMRDLLAGHLRLERYVLLLRGLEAIYKALEEGLAHHRDDPALVAASAPGLARHLAVVADLTHLHGPGWRHELRTARAAREYADRLRVIARTDPPLLLAHAWVRYFGDLHGGRILGRRIASAFALHDGQGLAFYDFAGLADPAVYMARFRAHLDELGRSPEIAARVLEESLDAFRRHIALFEEVEAMAIPAQLTPPRRSTSASPL